ncbi:MAG TPA: hypothetical protein VF046_07375 [Gemmatimonadales bacterium]
MSLELTELAAERATAATDGLLALVAAAGILALRRRTRPSFGRAVWQTALGAMGVASVLGAVAHGVALTDRARELLWQPLYLALGVTMALFVIGAVRDRYGDRAARRLLPPMLALALLFYAVTRATGGDFLVFVLYESAALLLALLIYLRLAVEGRSGAAAVAAAFALSLTAGAVQASGIGPVRLVWEFDHNGLFHLIELLGLVLLVAGLRRLLAVDQEPETA